MSAKANQKEEYRLRRSNRWIFGTMLFFGIAGLIAAFTLTVEKFHLLSDPQAQLSCSFNLVLNCATVMKTPQSSVFGFPNSIIGLMGYSVVITVAVAGLARVLFPRNFMLGAQIGFGLGLIFSYWLFFQSVYVIKVLCPWCLLVTLATTIIFEALLRYNLRENNLFLPVRTHEKIKVFLQKDFDKLIVAVWLVLMTVIVVVQFGEGLFA